MRAYADFIDPQTGEVIAAKYQPLTEAKLLAIEAAIGLDGLYCQQSIGIILVLHDLEDGPDNIGWRNPSELTNIENWVNYRRGQIAAAPWIRLMERLAERQQKGEAA